MTKKDFIALAEKLHRIYMVREPSHVVPARLAPEVTRVFHEVIAAICAVAERSNPRFDRDRFRAAVYNGQHKYRNKE